jgi:hypothetical protein
MVHRMPIEADCAASDKRPGLCISITFAAASVLKD